MKILVGLSGGVDSAIAAYLLKRQGHDVTCAFMRNWDSLVNNDIQGNDTAFDEICPQEADFNDAKAVANTLGLPLQRVDYIKEYWDEVFSVFIKESEKGRTPNPDILCNKYIKFDHFLKYALDQGFDYVATGHYAKVMHTTTGSYLYKAKDLNKDQSYFLAQISRFALSHALFPLANLDKPTIRQMAKDLDLSIATKKDSTGICFIGERHFKAFMQNYLPTKEGDIVDITTGKVLQRHQGVFFYTLGQRKGLNIGGAYGPWFVVGKDIEKNILYVANGNDEDWLVSDKCDVSDMNWFIDLSIGQTKHCQAKFRYRQADNDVTITKVDQNHVIVDYPQGIKAVTPGQQAVFYDNDLVIGGGTIDTIYRHNISLDERIDHHLCHKA